MSFVMNLTDNDPHLECRREIHRLRAENEQLRAELAAIRDSGDDEIDIFLTGVNAVESVYLEEQNTGPTPEVRVAAQDVTMTIRRLKSVCNIAKARGQKIAEQAAELKAVANERASYWAIYGDLQKVKTERDEATKKIAEQAKELKWAIRDRDNFWKFLTDEMKQNTGANEAQKQREIAACERAKIPYGGCDTVHDLADLIVVLIRERDEAIGLLKWLNDRSPLQLSQLRTREAKQIKELTGVTGENNNNS